MKKLGQKASFLTKILLVIGLLISNLSSLSVVFAYEATGDVIINLNDDILEIDYVEELAEEIQAVNVKVYENYTYSDGSSEEEVVTNYSLTAEQLLAASEGKLELNHDSIFASEDLENVEEEMVKNFKIFDGTYIVKVEIIDVTDYSENVVDETTVSEDETAIQTISVVDEEELINESTNTPEAILAVGTYEEEMIHESGLNIKLFDTYGSEIIKVNGKYPVSLGNSKVKVVAQILSGGLNPNDIFVYNNEEYRASELIGLEFSSEKDFAGHLYGAYELPVEVKVLKPLLNANAVDPETIVDEGLNDGQYEDVVYNDSVRIMYESYELNAEILNSVTQSEGYGDSYLFYSDSSDGLLYVFPNFEEQSDTYSLNVVTKSMLDLYNILNKALLDDESSNISYSLLKNGINILQSYDAASGETLEDYLASIVLDESVSLTLSNEGLSIIYDVVMFGDLTDDNIISEEDLLELINQVIGDKEIIDLDKSDIYGFDDVVDSLDVLYLNQVVKTQAWDFIVDELQVELDATLDVKFNGEKLSEENVLTSGDEFTVDYILSLTDYEVNGLSGLFKYDETLFELISVQTNNDWMGNNHEGKFIYLGDESLTGPELDVTEPEESEEIVVSEDSEDEVVPVDYVVVTATFKALKATNEESNNIINLDEIELYNSTDEEIILYTLDNTSLSTSSINVLASSDNSFKFLEVAGVEIVLEEGIYEYEITVSSDVTKVDLKYILNNVAASVTSEVYPEELAEGNNVITLTVTSEDGISQEYTITVIREEEIKEATTQVNYENYYNNYNDENTETEVVSPVVPEDEEIVEDKESNLSRIIIIILILIVIVGLVYLIFKDDDDEAKKANKDINKLKKASIESEVKVVKKEASNVTTKTTTKTTAKTSSNKNSNNNKTKTTKKNSSSKKKER